MSLRELQKKIQRGDVFEEVLDSNNITLPVRPRQSVYFVIPPITNNDTVVFTVGGVSSVDYQIFFQTYTLKNNILNLDSLTTIDSFSPKTFTRNLKTDTTYYLEIYSPNPSLTFGLTMFSKGFKLNKFLSSDMYWGYSTIFDLDVKKARPDQECDIPLRYKIIEGELPDGLRMTDTGKVLGVICNLDQMRKTLTDSPSFNWFFSSHEEGGGVFPIGKVFRFKVRVSLLGASPDDPEQNAEQWFCIRVLNNWSFDRGKFEEEVIQKAITNRYCPETTVVMSKLCCDDDYSSLENKERRFEEITFGNFCECPVIPLEEESWKKIELIRDVPVLADCVACQDPTNPLEIEIVNLEKVFKHPSEVIKYYLDGVAKGKSEIALSRLSVSPLFMELMDYMTKDDVRNTTSLIEMKLKGVVMTLYKFSDDLPLFHEEKKLLNERNRKNQSLEWDAYCSYGHSCEAFINWIFG